MHSFRFVSIQLCIHSAIIHFNYVFILFLVQIYKRCSSHIQTLFFTSIIFIYQLKTLQQFDLQQSNCTIIQSHFSSAYINSASHQFNFKSVQLHINSTSHQFNFTSFLPLDFLAPYDKASQNLLPLITFAYSRVYESGCDFMRQFIPTR